MRPIRTTSLAACILMVAQFSLAAAPPMITSGELRRLELNRDASIIVIDVRSVEAFSKGHIQGAKNIPASSIASAHLPLIAHIIVYCSEPTCALSSNAAKQLIDRDEIENERKK